MMVSALYVEKNGRYFGIENVDPWDQERDARSYDGPNPIVAHPPCQRWGKFWAGSPLVIKRTGVRKIKGDDDGCFSAALDSVRKWGGVLEHPWGSHAWKFFGLNMPPELAGGLRLIFMVDGRAVLSKGAMGTMPENQHCYWLTVQNSLNWIGALANQNLIPM